MYPAYIQLICKKNDNLLHLQQWSQWGYHFQGPLWGVWRDGAGGRAAAAPLQHLHQPPARSSSGETSELVQSGEVAAGRWQRERGSMVISIFPTRGLAELWPCSRLNTDSQWGETFTYWTKNLSALYPFLLHAGPTFGRSCQLFIVGPTDHSILD